MKPLAELPLDGLHVIAGSPGADGELWLVTVADPSGYRETAPSGASFARSHSSPHSTVLFCARDDGSIERIELPAAACNFHFAQPLPSGELLLVSSRCRRRPDGSVERNAAIFRRDGSLSGELTLGDGIEDVQVARDGTIWCGYFDEGVFGNYGWGGPDAEPIGARGLCAFGRDGERRFEFDATAAGTDIICDAYALNVADDAVWVYFYTDFPLVRLRAGRPDGVWRGAPGGARAFAVHGDRLLIDNGYQQHDHWSLCRLSAGGGVRVESAHSFTDDAGSPIGAGTAFGRGPFLHLLEEARWFRVDLRQIA